MSELPICAAHPAALFSRETTTLLSDIAGTEVISVGPPPGAESLAEVVEAIDSRRRSLGIARWVFWGMSGGSFLGQLYCRQYPNSLAGLILASSGPYFRLTVEDPACILSPRHPAWFSKLAAAGLHEGRYDGGPTEWRFVSGVGWVFRRANGAALLVSPDEPSADLQRMMPALWAFDARSWLGAVTVPALVMCGTADPIVPLAHAETLAALLPRAQFAPIAGAGHIPLTDHRDEVEHAVRGFLAAIAQDLGPA
jgi:pimeloyl-ACP methyl ester carboxylesterase